MKLNETVALLLGDNHPVITESVAVFEDNSCESEPCESEPMTSEPYEVQVGVFVHNSTYKEVLVNLAYLLHTGMHKMTLKIINSEL
jgi:hypothetical protein